MKKFTIAITLRNNKVIYLTQRSHSRKDALWVISQTADIHWGHDVVSVRCVKED